MKHVTVRATALLFTIALACILAGCGKQDRKGLLGIVVPVGQEHVGTDTPYVITGVYEGSPAFRAGLKPDDRIVQINGRELDGLEYDHIYNNLLLGPAGTKVTLVVERKGGTVVVDVIRGGE